MGNLRAVGMRPGATRSRPRSTAGARSSERVED